MLDFVWDNRGALWTLAGLLLVLALFINWIAWLFRVGRFALPPAGVAGPGNRQPLRFIVADLLAEIINDFRHLLALVVVLLFAVALFAAMYPGLAAQDVDKMTDGVQVVAAALGGLIGSIIGYYFGESAATRNVNQATTTTTENAGTPIQDVPVDMENVPGVVPAPAPPTPRTQD